MQLLTPLLALCVAVQVLAYAMGRGPLALVQSRTFWQFAAIMCMPVIPEEGMLNDMLYTLLLWHVCYPCTVSILQIPAPAFLVLLTV